MSRPQPKSNRDFSMTTCRVTPKGKKAVTMVIVHNCGAAFAPLFNIWRAQTTIFTEQDLVNFINGKGEFKAYTVEGWNREALKDETLRN